MPVSAGTILRQLKRAARIIGVDDRSWRKSTRYGTIIADLDRGFVADILEDRNVARCTDRLRSHPSIENVSRDRCGLYAPAVRQGSARALQVADRFHLVQNLRLVIEEQTNLPGRATARAILSEEDNIDAARHSHRARLAHRRSREEVFATIHAQRDRGCPAARSNGKPDTSVAAWRRSVAKWLAFKTPPDRRRAVLTPTSPCYFEDFLARCRKDGSRRGRHLFHDVKRRGDTGSFPNLERRLAVWRRAEKPAAGDPPPDDLRLEPVRDPHTGRGTSPVIAAAPASSHGGSSTAEQARRGDAVKTGPHAFATMRSLAMRVKGRRRGGRADPIDAWTRDAIESNLIPIMRFARLLRRDIAAVCSAIELR